MRPPLLQFGLQRGVALGVFRLRVVARERGFGLRDLRLVALDGGFGLRQRVFIRARIDAEKQFALRYVLAFGEIDRGQFAGDLRFDLHDGGSFHRADHAQFGGHGLFDYFRRGDRHDRRPGRGLRRRRILLTGAQSK